MEYPEISRLNKFIEDHKIVVKKLTEPIVDSNLIPLAFEFSGTSYTIQIQDEYEDLNYNNPSLDCLLVLRDLAIIEDSTDYLAWCNYMGLDTNNSFLLDYYKTMVNDLNRIRTYFPEGKIDYFITDLDFQLGSGPMSQLRAS